MFKSIRNQTAKSKPKNKKAARKAKAAEASADQPEPDSAPAVVPAATIPKPRRFAKSVAAAAQSTFVDARSSNPPGSGGMGFRSLLNVMRQPDRGESDQFSVSARPDSWD